MSQAMTVAGLSATHFEASHFFFEVIECPAHGIEFVIDREQFLKLIKLSLGEQWVEMHLDTRNKKLALKIMTTGGRLMNVNSVFFIADYGEGFVTRERMYRNVINMAALEFLDLLESWKMFEFLARVSFKSLCYLNQLGRSTFWHFHQG